MKIGTLRELKPIKTVSTLIFALLCLSLLSSCASEKAKQDTRLIEINTLNQSAHIHKTGFPGSPIKIPVENGGMIGSFQVEKYEASGEVDEIPTAYKLTFSFPITLASEYSAPGTEYITIKTSQSNILLSLDGGEETRELLIPWENACDLLRLNASIHLSKEELSSFSYSESEDMHSKLVDFAVNNTNQNFLTISAADNGGVIERHTYTIRKDGSTSPHQAYLVEDTFLKANEKLGPCL